MDGLDNSMLFIEYLIWATDNSITIMFMFPLKAMPIWINVMYIYNNIYKYSRLSNFNGNLKCLALARWARCACVPYDSLWRIRNRTWNHGQKQFHQSLLSACLVFLLFCSFFFLFFLVARFEMAPPTLCRNYNNWLLKTFLLITKWPFYIILQQPKQPKYLYNIIIYANRQNWNIVIVMAEIEMFSRRVYILKIVLVYIRGRRGIRNMQSELKTIQITIIM